jgi:hypothetical protein
MGWCNMVMKSFAPAKDAVKKGNNRALPRQKGNAVEMETIGLRPGKGNAVMDVCMDGF